MKRGSGNARRKAQRDAGSTCFVAWIPDDVLRLIMGRILLCHAPTFFRIRATCRALRSIDPQEAFKSFLMSMPAYRPCPHETFLMPWQRSRWCNLLLKSAGQSYLSSRYGCVVTHPGYEHIHSTSNIHNGTPLPSVGTVRWSMRLSKALCSLPTGHGIDTESIMKRCGIGFARGNSAWLYSPYTRQVHIVALDDPGLKSGLCESPPPLIDIQCGGAVHGFIVPGRLIRNEPESWHTFCYDNRTDTLSLDIGSRGSSTVVLDNLTSTFPSWPRGVPIRPVCILWTKDPALRVSAEVDHSFHVDL